MLSYVVFVHSAGKNVGMMIFDHDRHDNIFSSVSHCSPFNCCLSVVLWLDKGDYPENSHVVFRPNKLRFVVVFVLTFYVFGSSSSPT